MSRSAVPSPASAGEPAPTVWLVWSRRVPRGETDDWMRRMDAAGLATPVALESRDLRTALLELWLPDTAESRLLMRDWPETHGRTFGGRWREQADCDWVAASATPRAPLKIRDRLVIIDPAEPTVSGLATANDRIVLAVPTNMAFGTGDHATTSTVLRWLVDEARARSGTRKPGTAAWSFLDVGCGTGILALAARALGAEPVEGFDFDPAAVEISITNAEANRIAGIRFHQADLLQWQARDDRPAGWDVVAANVYGPVLAKAMPRLAAAVAAGGVLLLSGILHTQEADVTSAARLARLQVTRRTRRGRWVTLACARLD